MSPSVATATTRRGVVEEAHGQDPIGDLCLRRRGSEDLHLRATISDGEVEGILLDVCPVQEARAIVHGL